MGVLREMESQATIHSSLYTPEDGHRWDPDSLCTHAAQQIEKFWVHIWAVICRVCVMRCVNCSGCQVVEYHKAVLYAYIQDASACYIEACM